MNEELEAEDNIPPQQITLKRVIGEFIASFFGAYLFFSLIEGAIDKFSLNKAWSLEMFKPEKDKIFTMLVISIGWTLYRIAKNHNKLLATLDIFISKGVERVMCKAGANALRDTLIEAVVSEGTKSIPPKIAFHGYALEFLHELRSFDEELFPAVQVLAKNRVEALKSTVRHLKDDLAFSKIEGHEQVEMSEAFASKPAEKILFFDPQLYDNIDKDWSPSFKVFVDSTIKNLTAKKIQYLLFDDSINTLPAAHPKLVAYTERMKRAGFEIHSIPISSLIEVHNNPNLKARLEIYDETVAMKIESRKSYSDADKGKNEISVTLTASCRDYELGTFLRALHKHTPQP